MEKAPTGLRKRICIIGETNVGKSSLFNALLQNKTSIVSDTAGTTTDSVSKAYEILGFGPVIFCDTAGLNDNTPLGQERERATLDTLKISDCAVIVRQSAEPNEADKRILSVVQERRIPFIIVYNKCDLYTPPVGALQVNAKTGQGVDEVIEALRKALTGKHPERLLDGLVHAKESVLLVMPQDAAAPAGRLILPQVQTIRECLDKHAIVSGVTPEELPDALKKQDYDLVITDSKVIKEVLSVVKPTQRVSTFSVLFAKAKGDFETFLKGVDVIDTLQDGDFVLIAEACSHTTIEDDIARTVIPNLLKKYTQKTLNIEFSKGRKLPDDLSKYKLICQCGGCMLTRMEMMHRIESAEAQGTAITNYGLTITKCQMGDIHRLTF